MSQNHLADEKRSWLPSASIARSRARVAAPTPCERASVWLG